MNSSRLPNLRFFLLPALVIAVVAGSVVTALILVGSPKQERIRRADDARVEDLERIYGGITTYYDKHKRLPETLDQLTGIDSRLRIADAETKQPYKYRALNREEYELCATFETDASSKKDHSTLREEYNWHDEKLPFWKHTKGLTCFQLKIEKPPKNAGNFVPGLDL